MNYSLPALCTSKSEATLENRSAIGKARGRRILAVHRFVALAIVVCASSYLSGCAGVSFETGSPEPTSALSPALNGGLRGGQQPIVGAQVFLYAADATGYGKASDSLLKSPGYVTTDANGFFTITGDYTCPSASSQVYLYAVGGNPGAGINSAAGLLAGLGSCGALTSSTFIYMNEVSTVVTAFALAGFATDATHVSSSGSALALKGVANAFATIPNMETLSTGVALAKTPSGFGVVPQAEINTLANILASCINSTGPGSTACSTLLSDATNGSTTPADTATAAINIAHNPAANVVALYGLQTPNAPFQAALSSAPNDFSMEISFPGPGPWGFYSDLAIDGSGNVWVVGGFGTAGDGVGELLANTLAWSSTTPIVGGALATGSPSSLAIDPSGNIWVPTVPCNGCNNYLVEVSPSGTVLSGSMGFTASPTQIQLADTGPIAVDGSGNVWLPTAFNNVWEYFPGGNNFNWYSGAGLNAPTSIAFDTAGDAWIANNNNASISKFSSTGTVLSPNGSGFTGAGESNPVSIALDATGNIWLPNGNNGTVSEYSSSGAPLSTAAGYGGGNMSNNKGLAIDGANYVWVSGGCCNGNPSSITKLSATGAVLSGPNGYGTTNDLSSPTVIRIDPSGNLWVVNGSYNYILEYVGLAAPVVTPLSANLKTPYGNHAVNLP